MFNSHTLNDTEPQKHLHRVHFGLIKVGGGYRHKHGGPNFTTIRNPRSYHNWSITELTKTSRYGEHMVRKK